MTRALPFTEQSLRRAIAAARKEGMRVKGIQADGTLILDEVDNPSGDVADLAPATQPASSSKWEDVEA